MLRLEPRAEASRRRMEDPGAAIYFKLKDRPMVMACDRFTDIAANVRSLGLAIEGMRQLERHGGGAMMERAFTGFTALPPPMMAQRPWREVLGLKGTVTEADIQLTYRALAKKAHPDQGGKPGQMAELNHARDEALQAVGG